jgi:hypothetical protein
MKINRQQAEQHLKEGRPVAFYPEEGPHRTLDPGAVEGRRGSRNVNLPGEDEAGQYLLVRDEKGNLTRAGMEHVLRSGGTVLLDGELLESAADLPSEADLAKGDAQRTAQVRQAIDNQIATLQQQRTQLEAPSEGIQQPTAQQQERQEEPPRPTPPLAFRPPEGQDVRGSEEDTPERRRGRKGG